MYEDVAMAIDFNKFHCIPLASEEAEFIGKHLNILLINLRSHFLRLIHEEDEFMRKNVESIGLYPPHITPHLVWNHKA